MYNVHGIAQSICFRRNITLRAWEHCLLYFLTLSNLFQNLLQHTQSLGIIFISRLKNSKTRRRSVYCENLDYSLNKKFDIFRNVKIVCDVNNSIPKRKPLREALFNSSETTFFPTKNSQQTLKSTTDILKMNFKFQVCFSGFNDVPFKTTTDFFYCFLPSAESISKHREVSAHRCHLFSRRMKIISECSLVQLRMKF